MQTSLFSADEVASIILLLFIVSIEVWAGGIYCYLPSIRTEDGKYSRSRSFERQFLHFLTF